MEAAVLVDRTVNFTFFKEICRYKSYYFCKLTYNNMYRSPFLILPPKL